MKIYTKILGVVLFSILISLSILSVSFYVMARKAIFESNYKLIHSKGEEARSVIENNLKVLQKFGLDKIPANVIKAKKESAKELEGFKFGKTGMISVVDINGIVRIHPDPKHIGHKHIDKVLLNQKVENKNT